MRWDRNYGTSPPWLLSLFSRYLVILAERSNTQSIAKLWSWPHLNLCLIATPIYSSSCQRIHTRGTVILMLQEIKWEIINRHTQLITPRRQAELHHPTSKPTYRQFSKRSTPCWSVFFSFWSCWSCSTTWKMPHLRPLRPSLWICKATYRSFSYHSRHQIFVPFHFSTSLSHPPGLEWMVPKEK